MKRTKLLKSILIPTLGTSAIGAIAAGCTSCGNVSVTGISLNKNETTLVVGETETLTATVSPETATDKKVNWTSNNPSVATVDSNGKITAIAKGTATITATLIESPSAKATCEVTVNPIHVASVTLNKTSTTLDVGGTETLIATVSPETATDKTVKWTSNNTNVATVDEDGKITPIWEGTAEITATSVENPSAKATCEVNVTNPYVIITANEDSTFTLHNNRENNPNLQYSIDGNNWTTYKTTININRGHMLCLKGDNPSGWSHSEFIDSTLSIKGDVSISGNIMGLLDNGTGTTKTIPCDMCFCGLFQDSTGITGVSKSFLPARDLKDGCYAYMFEDCTSLTIAPELPATTLADECYSNMFQGCSSLTAAPDLPATILANRCYWEMFITCTSLTTAPKLPATGLAYSCYRGMFRFCTSLTTAPNLPATTLKDDCYKHMFQGCSSLSLIKIGYTGDYNSNYFDNWVNGVANSGTFHYVGIQTAQDFKLPSDWGIFGDTCVVIAANENSTLELKNEGRNNPDFQYSIDGTNWTPYSTTININQGQSLFLRGNNPTGWSHDGSQYSTLFIGGDISISGNVMGLLDNAAKSGEQGNITDIPCSYCFFDLFCNSTGIKRISDGFLPATSLKYGCYSYMFHFCSSLAKAPALPATALAKSCYSHMFDGCSSLTTAPNLPATSLAEYCYDSMFENCTSLIAAPELPALNLANNCYSFMFSYCSSLITAPKLPATDLKDGCYTYMFRGCSSLRTAPELPALNLANNCYMGMFKDCILLNSIHLGYTGDYNSNYFNNWVNGVTDSGEFYYYSVQTAQDFKLPSGWTKKADESRIVIIANEDSTLILNDSGENNLNLQYSTNGTNWTTYREAININQGQNLYLRGNNPNGWSHSDRIYSTLSITGDVSISGSVMSLLDNGAKQGESGDITDIPCNCCFYKLFENSTGIKSINKDFLHATTLANDCYSNMFQGCLSLTTAPDLPATSLRDGCYWEMFSGCKSLTTAPELPATTLANGCYLQMFRDCSSLTTAPELPATSLAEYCYDSMFENCTSLIAAPELPATDLADGCYMAMFQNCTSLTKAPKLDAAALAKSCYSHMFDGCSSLTTAPELPATDLALNCYWEMFSGCKSLNSIKIGYTGNYDDRYFGNWVVGVASSGEFHYNGSDTCANFGLPSGWIKA